MNVIKIYKFLIILLIIFSNMYCSNTSLTEFTLEESANMEKKTVPEEIFKYTNRLINENSPYLLLHAHNPIDWYPWGEEAFEKASMEDKPIFLSIGYTTCHWCHVMEEESFSDEEVAELINNSMIAIKVDREERPDIDSIYMNVSQMMTGSGGWPLNIIMTPEKIPFFAGTYIPKKSQYGRIGLIDLINSVNDAWLNNREQINSSAELVMNALKQFEDVSFSASELTAGIYDDAFNGLNNSFDSEYGGFRAAPKFPSAHNIIFLIRYWKRTGNELSLSMALNTLKNMRNGGIYDHVGFGFHRYSTDKEWHVPHFEKMLYDQAMISLAYIEAYMATSQIEFKETAEEIFTFVTRDMLSPEGSFYTSLDADTEGEEGKFYIWTYKEIEEVLGSDSSDIINLFHISLEGNYKDEASGKTTGNNILYLSNITSNSEQISGISNINLKNLWYEKVREQLLNARNVRTNPIKDDKILTDWNGLMIAAFAKAGVAFNNNSYIKIAENAADFFLNEMLNEDGSLFHTYRNGQAGIQANLDDYSFLSYGLIELYQADFNSKYLEAAMNLNKYTLDNFSDTDGTFFFTPENGEELLIREKKSFDNAIPSGNSIMLNNLLFLSHLTGSLEYQNAAEKLEHGFSGLISEYPAAHTMMLASLNFNMSSPIEIVIVGDPDMQDTQDMINTVSGLYIPNKVILFKPINGSKLSELAPFTQYYKAIDNSATAYVCRNFSCKLPTTDIDTMIDLILNE